MTFYLTLIISTGLIIYLQMLLWKKTKNFLLVLPTLFLYYWSMLGAWFITYDLFNNNKLENYGLHYYGYFQKLFAIELNGDYLKSIIYYALYIICYQLTCLFLIKKPQEQNGKKPITINHNLVFLISGLSLVLSYIFIRRQLEEASLNHESIYLFISHNNGKFYSLFQLFKSFSVLTAFTGFMIYLDRNQALQIASKPIKYGMVKYLLLITIVLFFTLIIGSRHDIVFSGLFTIIFSFINRKKVSPKNMVIVALTLMVPIFLIELTRAMPVLDALHLNMGEAPKEATQHFSGIQAVTSLVFSNEIFSGHMSMYGAIHYQVPITYGSSFATLAYSLVPRLILPNRPPDIYQHYITIAQNPGVQGFTINHITGWYLNFGVIGVILGGIALGALFAFIWNIFPKNMSEKRTLVRFMMILAIPGFIASIPMIIRTGPEGYKSVILEGMVIPAVLFWAASLNSEKKHYEL
ncbi:MAG: hypothetical protein IPP51_12215 [Bacteroidetes bacterium]|nr:hypothetical protein [Bacteroidota bacterium]